MKLLQLKNVAYSDNVRQVPEHLVLAEQATVYMDQLAKDCVPRIPGKWSAPRICAEWDRSEERAGQSVLTLRIWDEDGEGHTRFTPEELRNPLIRDHYLGRAFGDLLRQSIDKHLRAALEDGDDAGQ